MPLLDCEQAAPTVSRPRNMPPGILADLRGRNGNIELERPAVAHPRGRPKVHKLVWRDDLGLLGIRCRTSFAIGQRALLIRESDGCVLWIAFRWNH